MSKYKDRLDEGKNDAMVVGNCCSICGEELSEDQSMSGYYSRRHHFELHGLTTEDARYSALKKVGESVAVSAMKAFMKQFDPQSQ